MLVSLRFHVLFHSPPGVLFTFPSRYYFAIGHTGVFSLSRWSSMIHTGFHVPHATRDSTEQLQLSTTGLSPSLVQLSTVSSSLHHLVLSSHNPSSRNHWFRLFPFRSPLLGESRLLSLPLATKMFQFARFALSLLGCPIRTPPDQCSLPTPRSISLVAASFIASVCLGIHRKPFIA